MPPLFDFELISNATHPNHTQFDDSEGGCVPKADTKRAVILFPESSGPNQELSGLLEASILAFRLFQ